jgi:DNA-binding response OmpR family regulator
VQRILVVDDQQDSAELLVTLLRLEGFEADLMEDNWEGLVDEVAERKPDLVILDVRLSGVNGMDLLRQIRTQADLDVAQVSVLLTSALDHGYEGKLAGADGFLLKPYTRQSLLDAIQRIDTSSVPT